MQFAEEACFKSDGPKPMKLVVVLDLMFCHPLRQEESLALRTSANVARAGQHVHSVRSLTPFGDQSEIALATAKACQQWPMIWNFPESIRQELVRPAA